MAYSPPHAFRYELALCTVPEGQTLAQWRREAAGEDRRSQLRRSTLRDRLRGGRSAARSMSAR
jgi:hypothetical protein